MSECKGSYENASFYKEKNLGPVINSSNNDFNPVISDKEDLLVFSRSEAFYDALMFSTKVNGYGQSHRI